MNYIAPWWLPGGNLQTIWPALHARRLAPGEPPIAYRRERWTTPDDDFIHVDWLDEMAPTLPASRGSLPPEGAGLAWGGPAQRPIADGAPLLVLFHGLEGSSRSHYAETFASFARAHGLRYAVPHFRGCGSDELNAAPRAYHSGDHAEIGWILARFASLHDGPVVAVGVSLGGNALLRWAAEAGESASRSVRAVAAVSSPLDMAAGGRAIGRGFNRVVYTRMFLATMKPKALAKWDQHPGLFDREMLAEARDLRAFDDVFTGPLHGFKDAEDYYAASSAKPRLAAIRIPALAVNAKNDPFVPADSLPREGDVGDHVTLWQPAQGGHVGFPVGAWPGNVRAMPAAVGGWLLSAPGLRGPLDGVSVPARDPLADRADPGWGRTRRAS